MVEIPTFGMEAAPAATPQVNYDTGASDMWGNIARVTGALASKLSARADKIAAEEGAMAGAQAASLGAQPSGAAPVAGGYRASLFRTESGGKWDARNNEVGAGGKRGHFGRAQFGHARLQDAMNAGVLPQGTTPEQFLQSTELQVAVENWHFADLESKLAPYVGTVVNGQKLDMGALVAMAHLGGVGGARKYIESGGRHNPSDAFGTSLADYARTHGGSAVVAPAATGPGVPAPVTVPAPGPAPVPASTLPAFKLDRSGGPRAEAYNEAGMKIYLAKSEIALEDGFETIASQFADQPDKLAAELETFASGMIAGAEPEAQPRLRLMAERSKLGILRAAGEAHRKNLLAEQEAVATQSYERKRTSLVQLATRAGHDEAGNKAVAEAAAELEGFLDQNQFLTPEGRLKLKTEVTHDLLFTRTMGAFNNAETPEKRAAFVAALDEAWASGSAEISELTPESYSKLRASMDAALQKDHTARLKQVAVAKQALTGATKRIVNGDALPEAERVALRANVEATGDPALAESWGFLEQMQNWQAAARGLPPEAIRADIAADEARIAQEGLTPRGEEMLKIKRGLLKTVEEGLKENPLGLATRMGRTEVPGLDLNNFGESFAARVPVAKAVAATYGVEPRYFRPEEVSAMTKAVADNPDLMPRIAMAVAEAAGADAPRALKELSKDAPVLAHAAGLTLATGNQRFMLELQDSLKARQAEGYEPAEVPKMASPRSDALMLLPQLETAARKSAEIVFDTRMRQTGQEAVADFVWEETLSAALGEHEDGGKTLGGIAEINGMPTLLPTKMSAEDVQARISGLTDAVLAGLSPRISRNGIPISAAQLRGARFVAAGRNRWRVALGDPRGPDPKYVGAPGGGFWEIDLEALPAPSIQLGEGWNAAPDLAGAMP